MYVKTELNSTAWLTMVKSVKGSQVIEDIISSAEETLEQPQLGIKKGTVPFCNELIISYMYHLNLYNIRGVRNTQ